MNADTLGRAIELVARHQIRTALAYWAGLTAGIALFLIPPGMGLVTTIVLSMVLAFILLTITAAALVLVALVAVLYAHSLSKEQR